MTERQTNLVVRYKTLVVSLGAKAADTLEGSPHLFDPDPSRVPYQVQRRCQLDEQPQEPREGHPGQQVPPSAQALLLRCTDQAGANELLDRTFPRKNKAGLDWQALSDYLGSGPRFELDDSEGWSLLHWAAACGSPWLPTWLKANLKALAEPALSALAELVLRPDHDGFCALHWSCKQGSLATFEALWALLPESSWVGALTQKAFDDVSPQTLRDLAAYEGNDAILQAVLKLEDRAKVADVGFRFDKSTALQICDALKESPELTAASESPFSEVYARRCDKLVLEEARGWITGARSEQDLDRAIDQTELNAVILLENTSELNQRLLWVVDYLEKWDFSVVVVSIVGEDRSTLFSIPTYLKHCLRRRWGLKYLWERFDAYSRRNDGDKRRKQDDAQAHRKVIAFESRLTRVFLVDKESNRGSTLEPEDVMHAARSLMRLLAVTLESGDGRDDANLRSLFRLVFQRDNVHFATDNRAIERLCVDPAKPSKGTSFAEYLGRLLDDLDRTTASYACAGIFSLEAQLLDLKRYVELDQASKALEYLADPPGELVKDKIAVEPSGVGRANLIAREALDKFQLAELDRELLKDNSGSSAEVPSTLLIDHIYSAFGHVLHVNLADRLSNDSLGVEPILLLEDCKAPEVPLTARDGRPVKSRFPDKTVLSFREMAGPLRPVRFFRSLKEFNFETTRHTLRVVDEGVEAMKEVHDSRLNPSLILRNQDKQKRLSQILERAIQEQLQPDLTSKEVHSQPFANWRLVPYMLQELGQILGSHFTPKLRADALAPGTEAERTPLSSRLQRETVTQAEGFVEAIERLPKSRFMIFTVIGAALSTFLLVSPELGDGLHAAQFISSWLTKMAQTTGVPSPVLNLLAAGIGMAAIVWGIFLLLRSGVRTRYVKLKSKISEFLTERYRAQYEALELRLAIGNVASANRLKQQVAEWESWLKGMDGRISGFKTEVTKCLEDTRLKLSGETSFLRKALIKEEQAGKEGRSREALLLANSIIPKDLQVRTFQGVFIRTSEIFNKGKTTEQLLEKLRSGESYDLLSDDQTRELLSAVVELPSIRERVGAFVETHASRREVMFQVRKLPQYTLVETNQTFFGIMVKTLADRGMKSSLRTSLLREDEDFLGMNFINLCLHLDYPTMKEALGQWERD